MEDVQLYIDGAWRPGRSGRWQDVVDPATGEAIGRVAHADPEDLDDALAAAIKSDNDEKKVAAR